ncbi:MAG: CpaF family protein [Anaerolineae bacterium]|nr:MAG: CpaF family protein [Anaerolineae bacterium]
MQDAQLAPSPSPEMIARMRSWLKRKLSKELSLGAPASSIEITTRQLLETVLAQSKFALTAEAQDSLIEEVAATYAGFARIQPLLNNPEITEIMVNAPDQVFIERGGKLELTDVTFPDNRAIMGLIESIILPLGRRVDANSPTVDARLPDGSRVNAVIPPAAIDGPNLTIRKFAKEKLQFEDLIRLESITADIAKFLTACVTAHLNILVSGGTGSGKTTLLNILSSAIPEGERIVTIEDAAELDLHQTHRIRLETKPPDVDGAGEISIRHLVKNSLRMRPDRIIVGEVRGGEALDMLQAMNTGHDGSLTTVHANTPRDAVSRLETLVLLSGFDLPMKVVREQIASALDLIIQQARLSDGSRKVTSVTEVVGMEGETIVLNEIFKYDARNRNGTENGAAGIKPTGIRPMFEPKLKAAGFNFPPELFGADLTTLNSSRKRR